MALTREEKKEIIDSLKREISRQKIMIFLNFKGLKVNEFFSLRKKLKKADSHLMVAKKTLLNLVLKEKGLKVDKEQLEGELALALGYGDAISTAKTVWQFSQYNKNLKILGGFFEDKFREGKEIETLAQIPSREVLLVRLVGSISAPISNLLNVLERNIRGLIYVLAKAKA